MRLNSGEKSTELYYDLFIAYKYMQEKDEYREEVDKYAKLTQEYALDDISKNNEPSKSYVILSLISEHYKDNNQMLFYANKAVEADPKSADAYIARSDAYKALGKKKLAKADCDMAISLDPSYAETLKLLNESDKLVKGTDMFIGFFYFMLGLVIFIGIYSIYTAISGVIFN